MWGVQYTVEKWPGTIGFVGKFPETVAVVDKPFFSVRLKAEGLCGGDLLSVIGA